MKTLALFSFGLAISASAQTVTTVANISRESSVRLKTNGVFTVDQVSDGKTNKITYQEIVTEQAPVQVTKVLVGDYMPIATNRISLTKPLAPKPLLSAQRPPPKVATPPVKKPVAKPLATTNVLTAKDIRNITNSIPYRRANKLPPFDK